ncbi:universal stress protein [Candidatus Hydrogenedentota bacterium]
MFKNILVPTDGSEKCAYAVQNAIEIAKKYDATLTGLHVIDLKLLEGPLLRDISASLGMEPFGNYQAGIKDVLEEKSKTALDMFENACEDEGVKHKTESATGLLGKTISEHCALADLTVMGRRGENAEWAGEAMLGSTVETVVRKADRPVWVTSSELTGLKRILMPFDGSQQACHALATAANMAREWNIPLELVSFFSPNDEDGSLAISKGKEYLEAQEVEFEAHLIDGDPDTEIPSYAESCGADLIVMGAYGHSRVRSLVLGSTTARVIRAVKCPVLLNR